MIAKPKTPAPKKKKPTQLDRIERSIGLIESKLATLYAWERLEEAMSEAKLASPTVAVEEVKPLKAGDWFMVVRTWNCGYKVGDVIQAIRVDEGGDPWFAPTRYYDGEICLSVIRKELRAATPEEIAAHEAKVKAEAKAAEDAKLVFGARVECEGREWYIASITPDKGGHYLIARTDNAGLYMSWRRQRNEFTLLP